MMRGFSSLLAVCLAFAGCTSDDSSDVDAAAATTATTTTIARIETTSPPVTTSTTTTTSPPTTTSTTTASTSTTTTTTLPPVTDMEAGLFCRDLFALGYDYTAAVTYWVKEGSPDRMDADRNGIPCETVYERSEVVAFWGEPLPTTTAAPSLTMAAVDSYVGDQWVRAGGYTDDWECEIEYGRDLSTGTVLICRPHDRGDGEYPVLTALVLDNAGTIALAESGLYRTELLSWYLGDLMGSGKYCRDVINPEIGLPAWIDDPHLRYFGCVLYWFMEGRPDRMDADVNGVPCETLFDSGVVSKFRRGGLFGDIS